MAKAPTAAQQLQDANALLSKLGIQENRLVDDQAVALTLVERLNILCGHDGTEDDREKAKALTAYGRLRGPMFDAIMGHIADLALPFAKLTEQQQFDFMRAIRSMIDSHLNKAVRAIISSDLPSVTASLGDFTTKSDEIVAKFTTPRTMHALEALGAHGMRPIHIIFADPKMMDDGTYEEQSHATPDEPEFDDLLSQGNDEDLADAGEADVEGDDSADQAENEKEGTD